MDDIVRLYTHRVTLESHNEQVNANLNIFKYVYVCVNIILYKNMSVIHGFMYTNSPRTFREED